MESSSDNLFIQSPLISALFRFSVENRGGKNSSQTVSKGKNTPEKHKTPFWAALKSRQVRKNGQKCNPVPRTVTYSLHLWFSGTWVSSF